MSEEKRPRREPITEADRREQLRLHTFSSLGMKPPRTKKEKNRLAAMVRKLGKTG